MSKLLIGGSEKEFAFTFKAIRIFCEEKKISISDFFSNVKDYISINNIDITIFAGLKAAGDDVTIEQVLGWLEPLTIPELTTLMQDVSKVLTESITVEKKAEEATAPASV